MGGEGQRPVEYAKPNENHNTRMRNVKLNIKPTFPSISAEGRMPST